MATGQFLFTSLQSSFSCLHGLRRASCIAGCASSRLAQSRAVALPQSYRGFARHSSQATKLEEVKSHISEDGLGSSAARKYRGITLDGPKARKVQRLLEDDEFGALQYPRIQRQEHRQLSVESLIKLIESNAALSHCSNGPAQSLEDSTQDPSKAGQSSTGPFSISGRILNCRSASSSLHFIDLEQEGHQIQVECNANELAIDCTTNKTEVSTKLKKLFKLLGRGDIISVVGIPWRSQRGGPCLRATTLPKLLAPSIASIPTKLGDPNMRMKYRHIDMLVNPSVSQTLRHRSDIIQRIRTFLLDRSFVEVNTPILAASAGGATARPFITSASEFSEKDVALRIAPELWLKRLMIGGFDRVFEIGPVFRNEGIDATHNPEFTTCEFYQAFASLEDLMEMTTEMVCSIVASRAPNLEWKCPVSRKQFEETFKCIDFIPAIEKALGLPLPVLHSDHALEELMGIFREKGLPMPAKVTLDTLLDKLGSIHIEPHCITPTYVVRQPSCMAPLAKFNEVQGQLVSHRAELYIDRQEIANMYEEQNSPFLQLAAFKQQAGWRTLENGGSTGSTEPPPFIDEDYVEALQCALPPTGGWGCGIDRLVMLLTGQSRINDVLPFGTLRNVVALGSQRSR